MVSKEKEMTEFVRVKMSIGDSSITAWAIVIQRTDKKVIYRQIQADGHRMVGRKHGEVHYLMGHPDDIISEKPARMNGKYARMEVVK